MMMFMESHYRQARFHKCYYRPSCLMCWSRAALILIIVKMRQVIKRKRTHALTILNEYILLLSLTSLQDGDLEPIYRQGLADRSLRWHHRSELRRAYLALMDGSR